MTDRWETYCELPKTMTVKEVHPVSKLDELIAERDRLYRERHEAEARLEAAEEAVLEERFKDVERFKEGDVVLVPRKLFGQIKWWPAQIYDVSLSYTEGWYSDTYDRDPGGHWENRNVYYRVRLQDKDSDAFSGKLDGFAHHQVQAKTNA